VGCLSHFLHLDRRIDENDDEFSAQRPSTVRSTGSPSTNW
jgi:hypothetical protein